MIASDRQEKERIDARNALEEYLYDLRSKIGNDDELATFVNENDRTTFTHQLDTMEYWLYEEGEDCNRQVYTEKLASLKVPFLIGIYMGTEPGSLALQVLFHQATGSRS